MSELPLPKFKVIDPVKSDTLTREITPSVEAAAIGLQNYEIVGRKGNLTVIVTQGKNPMTGREEPALVLANRNDPVNRHVFVLLSQLYQVIQPKAMTEVAPMLAARLYGFYTKDDLFKITDALFDFAEDLQKAKPARHLGNQQWLEALAHDGFTIQHQGKNLN
jgi:hypothetical protein